MNFTAQLIAVAMAVTLAVVWIVRRLTGIRRGGSSCSCGSRSSKRCNDSSKRHDGCDGCPVAEACRKKK